MSNSLELRTNSAVVEIGGTAYQLDFDPQALSFAEQVYEDEYDKDVNAAVIIQEVFSAKMSAVSAIIYGALRSAGNKILWKAFTKTIFTYDHFDTLLDAAMRGIDSMMPRSTAPVEEADPKN